MLTIRPARPDDVAALWGVIGPVIRAGDTYAVDHAMGEAEALAWWTGADRDTFVATDETGAVVGTYYLRANQGGGGRHVGNCGYATHAAARGRGVARRMAEHSLEQARARGFRAMQFNFVVSTNRPAIRLWLALGFEVVGTLPGAFAHPDGREVDALVMFRTL